MAAAATSRSARAAAGLQLWLAGVAQLCRADGSSEALAPRDAALLAWLAVEGPTERGRLAALLWPDSDAARARNALRQRLFQLRRLAGTELVQGSTVLSLAPGVVHDLEAADTLLGDSALPLSAEFGDWLAQQRMARRQRRLQVLAGQADAAERAADLAQALVHAGALLALDPLSEPAHRRLMRLHYLAGDRPAALLAFDRCEQALKHEVGVGPGPETLALLAVVERAQPLDGQRPGMPAALLRPPRLVGREPLLQQGLAAWARGQALLVCGEPGLGTSRLLQELGAARPGFVQAAAQPGDLHRPGATMARLLRGVLERLPATAPPLPTTPREVAALLQAARRHGLQTLLLDDLHLADPESLALLAALLREAAAGPALLPCWGLGLPAGAADESWQTQLVQDELLHPLRLVPLDLAQQRELLDSLDLAGIDAGRLAAPLDRLAGGHPKFMLDLLRQAHEPAAADARHAALAALATGDGLPHPAGPLQQLQDRLQRLDAPARRLLQAAALAGEPVNARLVDAVLDLPAAARPEAWASLNRAGLLRDGAPAYELLAAAARASVAPAGAADLQARIATHLAGRSAAPERVAGHWMQAGRWAEAGAAYRAAADGARDAGRRLEEAALLERAAEALAQAGAADDRFALLLRRAEVLAAYELADAAQASLATVQSAAADELQRLQALLVRVQAAAKRSETDTTLSLAPDGMAQAGALGRTDLVLEFTLPLCEVLCDLRRPAEALALLEPLAGWVGSGAATDEQAWRYWSTRALALDYANRLGDAVAAGEAAVALARRLGRDDLLWQSLQDLGSTQAKRGHVRQAVDAGRQALALASACGDAGLGRVHELRMVLAHRLRDVGEYAQALPLQEQALAFFRAGGLAAGITSAENRLAQTFLQLGQPARARALLATPHAGAFEALAVVRLMLQAETARLSGGDATGTIRAALARTPQRDDVYHRLVALFASAMVPADEGEGLALGVAAWASLHQRQGLALAGHVRAAGCALAQGALQRALPHAEAALQLARDVQPDSFYLPELWLTAARVFEQAGDAAAAAEALQTGAHWVRRTAAERVPAAFRDSFLHRNPVNRELLAALARGRPPA